MTVATMRYYANTRQQLDFQSHLGKISLCEVWLDWVDRAICHIYRDDRIPVNVPLLVAIWGGPEYDKIRTVLCCFNEAFCYLPELEADAEGIPATNYVYESVVLPDQLNKLGPEDRMLFFMPPDREQQVYVLWSEYHKKLAKTNYGRCLHAALYEMP